MILTLHDTTATQLSQFIASPTHAVLIAGPDGIGKTAIAEHLITTILQLEPLALASYPHYNRVVAASASSISIDAIRDLQRFLQLKTIGTNPYRRAVLIEHAQALTTEAQNAYLKLLEEPPADTIMVLTVNSARSLLPTIRSRLQIITVHAPTEAQLQALLQTLTNDAVTGRQAYFLSGGLPGLLTALLSGDDTHPMVAGVAAAKEILQKDTFERLSLVDGLSKQKDTAAAVLAALARIAEAGIDSASKQQAAGKLKQWHTIRKHTLAAREALSRSVNAKLVLSNLFLQL